MIENNFDVELSNGHSHYRKPQPFSNQNLNLRILPRIYLRKKALVCNGVVLDLHKRPMTRRLISAFCKNSKQKLSRNELVNIIYEGFDPQDKSRRFNEVLRQNVTKLVSRARLICENTFNQGEDQWIEFFVYNSEEEVWNFYRLKNEYLKKKESILLH